jgi:MraZ protein
MFYGEFDYKLDEKGRLMIPPKFRSIFKDGIVLTSSAENCITGYTIAEWKKLSDSLTSSPLARSKMRRLNRAIFATAFNTTIDGQGRVAIPAPLREHAQIIDDAVVVGINTYLEIWNKALWDEEKTLSQEQAYQIIESLEHNEK